MEVRPVVFRVHAAHQVGVGCEIQALRHVDERLLLDVQPHTTPGLLRL